jgi:outer membrane scaffolding protein for murein synthesis (MipA/OmpV family)
LILLFSWPNIAVCEEEPLWELGAGLVLLQMPDYFGSDKNRLYLLPYPYFVYRGDILDIDRDRIAGRVFKTDRILLDLSFFGQVPVESSDNEARQGMPDLDPTFEVGPSLEITLWHNRQDHQKLYLFLPVRAVFSTDFSSLRHEGWVFGPRLVYEINDLFASPHFDLDVSAGPTFADSAYHRYYYSVESAYATPSRPAYSAGGGYSGTALTLGLSKSYKQMIFSAFVSVDFLQGAAFEDSPLVKTKTSVMSGFMVSWIFMKSAKTVPVER